MAIVSMSETKRIVQQWTDEVKKPAAIRSTLFNEVQVYTKFPGYYIGLHGGLIDKYRRMLKSIGWDNVVVYELQEVFKPNADKRSKKNDTCKSSV